MTNFNLQIPDEFLPVLDLLVQTSGAGTRDAYIRNTIGNILIQTQVSQDFAAPMQQRTTHLLTYWQS